MVDPSIAVGYSLMGAGSGLVGRLMQHLFPTPLELAQTASIYENLALSRKRLEAEEQRIQREWDVRRELLAQQIAANQELERDKDLMRSWPLGIRPAAFLRYSQQRRGTALNVIVRPTLRRLADSDRGLLASLASHMALATDQLISSTASLFGDEVIYYQETGGSKDPHAPPLSGQQLDATIYSLTSTEPTALLQVSLASATSIRLSWSCWGWSGDKGAPAVGSVLAEVGEENAGRPRQIEIAILAIVCALSDQFQTVRTLRDPRGPAMFKFLHLAPQALFLADGQPERSPTTEAAPAFLFNSLSSTLHSIAATAPLLAAESAAKAAVTAEESGQPALAEAFLSLSLEHYRSIDPLRLADESVLTRKLMMGGDSKTRSSVRSALSKVRKIDRLEYIEANSKMTTTNILDRLKEFDSELSPGDRQKLRDKLVEMLSYVPTIGFFGKAGVGKSSLCNALFGRDAFAVDDIDACTREPQTVLMKLGKDRDLTLLDVPGVGESRMRDSEYSALYKSLLPKTDALVWVLKADDRAYSVDQDFFTNVVKPHIERGTPFLIALNQVDKIQPYRDWRVEERRPGDQQERNIRLKRKSVADMFDIEEELVVAVSAEEKYGLRDLVDRLILSLPDVKKVSLAVAMPSKNISKKAVEAVEKGIENEFSRAAPAAAIGAVGGAVYGTIIFPGVGTVIGGIAGAVAGWLFGRSRKK